MLIFIPSNYCLIFIGFLDKKDKDDDDDDEEEEEGGQMTLNEAPETHPKVSPRWPTRIFATECVRKIIGVCETERAHIDLALARELRQETGEGLYAILLLSIMLFRVHL